MALALLRTPGARDQARLAVPGLAAAAFLCALVLHVRLSDPLDALVRGVWGGFLLVLACLGASAWIMAMAIAGIPAGGRRLLGASAAVVTATGVAGLLAVGWNHGAIDAGDSYIFIAQGGKDWARERPFRLRGTRIGQEIFHAGSGTWLVHDCAAGESRIEHEGRAILHLRSTVAMLDRVHGCQSVGMAR